MGGVDKENEQPECESGFSAGMFLLGLAAGAAIGAGIALMYAPQTGEESRSDVADVAAGLKDRVVGTYANLADKTSDALGVAREHITSALDEAKDAAAETVEGARSAVDQWVSRGKRTVDDARTRLDTAVEAGRTEYATRKRDLDAEFEASLDD